MEEEKKLHLPTAVKRTLWIILGVVLIALAVFIIWYLSNFRNYGAYRALITEPAKLEEGAELSAQKDAENRVPGFEIVAENEQIALFLKRDTAEIALLDKRNGKTVYSNPQDASKDPVARSGLNQENLESQFILSYLDKYAKEGTAWSSYAKASANGQVEFEKIQDGLRAVYTLSDQKILLVPNQMTAEWFDILSVTGKKQAAQSYEFNEENGLYTMKPRGVSNRHKLQIDLDAREAGFTIEDLEEMNALVETEEEEADEEQ